MKALALVAIVLAVQSPTMPQGVMVVPTMGNVLVLYWDAPLMPDGNPCSCETQHWPEACRVPPVIGYQVKVGTTPDVRKQSNALAPAEFTAGCDADPTKRSWALLKGTRGVRYYMIVRQQYGGYNIPPGERYSDWSDEVSAVQP